LLLLAVWRETLIKKRTECNCVIRRFFHIDKFAKKCSKFFATFFTATNQPHKRSGNTDALFEQGAWFPLASYQVVFVLTAVDLN